MLTDRQGAFLGLHLWAHAVLALIYHPELLKSPSGIETPLNQGISRNIKLSLASSRQICECMVFADLVSGESYVSGSKSMTNRIFTPPAYVAVAVEMCANPMTDLNAVHRPAALRRSVSRPAVTSRRFR
jgi:hypothetical protein